MSRYHVQMVDLWAMRAGDGPRILGRLVEACDQLGSERLAAEMSEDDRGRYAIIWQQASWQADMHLVDAWRHGRQAPAEILDEMRESLCSHAE